MSSETIIPQPAPSPPLPWWERLMDRIIPDNKGWMTIAAVIIVLFLLQMIRDQPSLLANASFMQFCATLVGVFLLIGNHFFGGTKSGSDVAAANAATVNAAAVTGTAAAPGTTSSTTTTTTTKDPP